MVLIILVLKMGSHFSPVPKSHLGAALAHDAAISPKMNGMLFNLIPLSGSAVAYWGYWNETQAIMNARELASGAHCNFPSYGYSFTLHFFFFF